MLAFGSRLCLPLVALAFGRRCRLCLLCAPPLFAPLLSHTLPLGTLRRLQLLEALAPCGRSRRRPALRHFQ